MNKEKLLEILAACARDMDPEGAHGEADDALIEYIDDAEIKEAFAKITKWYA